MTTQGKSALNTTKEELQETIATWDSDLIEGYWEYMDTAAQTSDIPDHAQHFAQLAQTCEDTLNERWSMK